VKGIDMPAAAAERGAVVFLDVADTLVEGFDLVDFLYKLTEHTTELSSASAAGLLLADLGGNLHFMAASDERAQMLELFQLQADEGPCRDCYHSGEPVSASNFQSGDAPWPGFTALATSAGFRSVHAFPLRLRGEVIGALGVFDAVATAMDPAVTRIVQALADVAAIALLQERAIRRAELLTEQLQGAINNRVVIEQAKGALAQIHDINVEDAFTLLRTYVRDNHLRLTEIARTILLSPTDVPALTIR
jgi:GAF domain-containing protein